jgi:hypothetical protein
MDSFVESLCISFDGPVAEEWVQVAAKLQYQKFETNIPRKGIARPQSL